MVRIMKKIRLLFAAVLITVLVLPAVMASENQGLTAPPKGSEWKSLYEGKGLEGWHTRGKPNDSHIMSWTSINGVLVNIPPMEEGKHGIDLVSDKVLGSHELYIEFFVPKGSNSGVYLIGQYEIQVLDSYGKEKPSLTDCGGIYNKVAPSVNASKPAGQWQCFHAIFHKAKAKDGKAIKKPRITVFHNGTKILDKVEIEGVTGAALNGRVIEEGPTYLQGDHGQVMYRNIFYKPITD